MHAAAVVHLLLRDGCRMYHGEELDVGGILHPIRDIVPGSQLWGLLLLTFILAHPPMGNTGQTLCDNISSLSRHAC